MILFSVFSQVIQAEMFKYEKNLFKTLKKN